MRRFCRGHVSDSGRGGARRRRLRLCPPPASLSARPDTPPPACVCLAVAEHVPYQLGCAHRHSGAPRPSCSIRTCARTAPQDHRLRSALDAVPDHEFGHAGRGEKLSAAPAVADPHAGADPPDRPGAPVRARRFPRPPRAGARFRFWPPARPLRGKSRMLVAASGFLSRSLLSGPPVPRARLPARTAVPNDFAAANFRPRSGPRTKAARTRVCRTPAGKPVVSHSGSRTARLRACLMSKKCHCLYRWQYYESR